MSSNLQDLARYILLSREQHGADQARANIVADLRL